jgi:hypothetical protein
LLPKPSPVAAELPESALMTWQDKANKMATLTHRQKVRFILMFNWYDKNYCFGALMPRERNYYYYYDYN